MRWTPGTKTGKRGLMPPWMLKGEEFDMRDVGDIRHEFQEPKPARPAKQAMRFVDAPRQTRRTVQTVTVSRRVGVRPGEVVLSEGGPRHRAKPGVVLELERQREERRAAAAAAPTRRRRRRKS